MAKPGQVTADEFIGTVIRLGRLKIFTIEMRDEKRADVTRDNRVLAVCVLDDPDTGREERFQATGITMGHALEDCRTLIREHFGILSVS